MNSRLPSRPSPAAQNGDAPDSNLQAIRRFFLISSERSGSTLFRLMLEHHPLIHCAHESDFMVAYFDQCQNAPPASFTKLLHADRGFCASRLDIPLNARTYQDVIDSFFQQFSNASGKSLVGTTIHHHFHHLPALAPEAKYIHLLRDGRPVAASIVRMGWVGNAYFGALRWRNDVTQICRLQKHVAPDRWLEVRYEALLADPPRILEQVCKFLGAPYQEQMLSYPQDSTYDPPDPTHVDRWRTRLPPREIYQAEMAAGDLLHQLGYHPLFPSADPARLERLGLRLHNRWARARLHCQRYGTYLVAARKLWRLLGIRRPHLEQRYEAIRDAYIK